MNTTFRRQVTLIVGLLLAATILLGLSFWGLFNRYITSERKESLSNTADAVAALSRVYSSVQSISGDWDFRMNLALATAASGNDILICSPEGQTLVCAQDVQGCRHVNQFIGQDTAAAILAGDDADLNDVATAIYGHDRIAVANPVIADETPVCIVLVSVRRTAVANFTGGALRIFILTALMVFSVALLATPYLTSRETKPIRDMAAAARRLAHGNYSVRVATGHQNEEIEELAVAFNNMAASMQNADGARQEFVANVSHELKTPMTTIAGYMDGMLDGTIPPEKQRQYMELVSTEVRRLSRLVRSMLDVSRLKDQGIPEDKLTVFDLCEAAGQALLSFEQRINRKQLNVEIDMPDLGVNIHAMQDYVTQVLYNLLDNAVKFVDQGGTLSIHVTTSGGKAVTIIGNTGPTIAPEELPLIFDRFHKTDKSRSGDRDGVGLGLYIVKTIVLAHGEDIYVTSRDGKTEFTFTMPLSR